MARGLRSLLPAVVLVLACDRPAGDRQPSQSEIVGWYSLRGESSPGFVAEEEDHLCLRADGTYLQQHSYGDGRVLMGAVRGWSLVEGRVHLQEWHDYWRVTDRPDSKPNIGVSMRAQLSSNGTFILLVDPDRNVLYLREGACPGRV